MITGKKKLIVLGLKWDFNYMVIVGSIVAAQLTLHLAKCSWTVIKEGEAPLIKSFHGSSFEFDCIVSAEELK